MFSEGFPKLQDLRKIRKLVDTKNILAFNSVFKKWILLWFAYVFKVVVYFYKWLLLENDSILSSYLSIARHEECWKRSSVPANSIQSGVLSMRVKLFKTTLSICRLVLDIFITLDSMGQNSTLILINPTIRGGASLAPFVIQMTPKNLTFFPNTYANTSHTLLEPQNGLKMGFYSIFTFGGTKIWI